MQKILISYNRRTCQFSYQRVQKLPQDNELPFGCPSKQASILAFYMNRQNHVEKLSKQEDLDERDQLSFVAPTEQYQQNGLSVLEDSSSFYQIESNYLQKGLVWNQEDWLGISGSQATSERKKVQLTKSSYISFSSDSIWWSFNENQSSKSNSVNFKQPRQIQFDSQQKPIYSMSNIYSLKNLNSLCFPKTYNHDLSTFHDEETNIYSSYQKNNPKLAMKEIQFGKSLGQKLLLRQKQQKTKPSTINLLNQTFEDFASNQILHHIQPLELSTLCVELESAQDSDQSTLIQNSQSQIMCQNLFSSSIYTDHLERINKKELTNKDEAMQILRGFYHLLDKLEPVDIIKKFKTFQQERRMGSQYQKRQVKVQKSFKEGSSDSDDDKSSSNLSLTSQKNCPKVSRLIEILSILILLKEGNSQI